MWKTVALVVVGFAVISLSSGSPEPGVITVSDYMLTDEANNKICSVNKDGTRSCSAKALQKLNFLSSWIVEGVDCRNLWISLVWEGLQYNSSTRSFACPDTCHHHNLVIHGQCETQEVDVGKHILESFPITSPANKALQVMNLIADADFMNGAKIRDKFVGKMYVRVC